MIYYIFLALGFLTGLTAYQTRQPHGLTLLDVLFFVAISAIWPVSLASAGTVGVCRGWVWLENKEFMNKKIGGGE